VTAQANMAARFPQIGREVPEFEQEDLRELFVHSHRLIYRVHENQVVVLRVWHGARLLRESDLGEEE
jgi:toxin ParE1/3/4